MVTSLMVLSVLLFYNSRPHSVQLDAAAAAAAAAILQLRVTVAATAAAEQTKASGPLVFGYYLHMRSFVN